MNELSIEQKAKAYDLAIKKAKSKIKNDKDHVLYEEDIIDIFPELKESEDERIRNEIILYIGAKNDISLDTHNKWLSWLEKNMEKLQPKKEWDKEDEKYISSIIKMVEHCCFSSIGEITKAAAIDWLKQFKDRYT